MTAAPVDKAKVIAYALQHGQTAAAAVFSVPLGSVKGWVHRYQSKAPLASVTTEADVTVTSDEAREVIGEGSAPSSGSEVARVSRKITAETFLEDLRVELVGGLRIIRRARLSKAPIMEKAKVLIAGLEKLERAGRVPFGYGMEGQSGRAGLINVTIHNDRHDSLPPAAITIEAQAEVMPAAIEGPAADPVETDPEG